jgi:hypothetical protein
MKRPADPPGLCRGCRIAHGNSLSEKSWPNFVIFLCFVVKISSCIIVKDQKRLPIPLIPFGSEVYLPRNTQKTQKNINLISLLISCILSISWLKECSNCQRNKPFKGFLANQIKYFLIVAFYASPIREQGNNFGGRY